jgi:putative hydrolase of the HAD superfamily
MIPIRALLLDFGGTLDSDGKHWSTQFAESFAAAEANLARATLDQAFLAADRAIGQDARAETMELPDYVCEYVRRMLDLVDIHRAGLADRIAEHFLRESRIHLRASAAHLARLRGRVRMAVVSNFTANLPLILHQAGLAPLLDAVVCSAIEGVKKPDAAIFRIALQRLGVDAAETAMIGDSLGNDIVPAKSAGLATVWLRGDRRFADGPASAADRVASTFAQALSLLPAAVGTAG